MDIYYFDSREQQSGILGGINLTINLLLAYFFYFYSYHNPDHGDCWASPVSEIASPVEVNGATNVAAQFDAWFKAGFILTLISMALSAFLFLHSVTASELVEKMSTCFARLLSLCILIWLITGCVFRWRHIGLVCTGHFT